MLLWTVAPNLSASITLVYDYQITLIMLSGSVNASPRAGENSFAAWDGIEFETLRALLHLLRCQMGLLHA